MPRMVEGTPWEGSGGGGSERIRLTTHHHRVLVLLAEFDKSIPRHIELFLDEVQAGLDLE